MTYKETMLQNNLTMDVYLGEVQIDHSSGLQMVGTSTVKVSANGLVYVVSDELYKKSKFFGRAMFYSISIDGKRTDARLCTSDLKMNRNIVFNVNETNGEISYSYTFYPTKSAVLESRIFRSFRPPSGGQGEEGVVTREIRFIDT